MAQEAPRWLDEDEKRAWRALLQATRSLFDAVDRELQADAGMSQGDYEILVRLAEAEGTIRMGDLAAQTLFSRSRLSHAVGRLEEAGWVERQGCPSDKRGTFAVLTDQGRRALEAAAPGHVETVRRLVFDRLTPAQVAQLERIAAIIGSPPP